MEIGDRVRIRVTAETAAAGWAKREGTFYGVTTPSVTGVDVFDATDDLGYAVGFDDAEVEWFNPSLVEWLGFDPDGIAMVGDTRFIRDAEGNWVPDSN